MTAIAYRGYTIAPDPYWRWVWSHNEYDGPEDSRCGTAASLEEAQREIDEQIQEES